MKISDHMNVFTLRKKILLASKLMGVILMVSYVFSSPDLRDGLMDGPVYYKAGVRA